MGFILLSAYYKTRTNGTLEHLRNNGTLAKQSEYLKIVEHGKSNGITEQQNNTNKYYHCRTATY